MNGIALPAIAATGTLSHLTVRHTGRKPPLTVDVHLDDDRTLTIGASVAQLQTLAKLQALVADTLNVWLSWDGEDQRPRMMREDWAWLVQKGFAAGGQTA